MRRLVFAVLVASLLPAPAAAQAWLKRAEADLLYVLDRFSGEVLQELKIPSAHDSLEIRDGFLWARCYNVDLKLKIVEAPGGR